MSTKDLFGAELPSDDESDDEDYVTEHEGSSDEEHMDMIDGSRGDFKTNIRHYKVSKLFQEMKNSVELKVSTEDHSDQYIDPLMLEFQKPNPHIPPPKSTEYIFTELKKFSNIARQDQPPTDVRKYKQLARSQLTGQDMTEAVKNALLGILRSQIEVNEEVRFAGEVVKLKKLVERTSTHAQKFERKKRELDNSSSSLGGLQSYLNQIKSRRAVTSVEKSATDWNQLKLSTEGMEQSLKADRGFLDKQAFLVKSDLKEDELRRDARRRKLMEQNP